MRRTSWLVVSVLLSVSFAAPAAADWLVTRDGGRIETKGKWRVEGAKVVFTLPNGTMGVMRKSEVDLDASAVASTEGVKPSADAKVESPKTPVLTLTDKDIAKAAPVAPVGATGAAAPAAAASTSPRKSAAVVVQSWRQDPAQDGGVELSGVLVNVGVDIAVNITVEVEVKDGEGKSHKAVGFPAKTSLVRDKETTFRAILPDLNEIMGEPIIKVGSEGASVGVEPDQPAKAAAGAGL